MRRTTDSQGQGRLRRGEVSGVGTEGKLLMGKVGTRAQQQGLPGLGRAGTKMQGGQHRAVHKKQRNRSDWSIVRDGGR